MKVSVKRGNKKRLKSLKETKRDVGKAARSRAEPTSFHYPISETLRWISDGEKLLRKWGAIKSPFARKIARGFEKVLTVLETVNELRRM